MKGTIPGLQDRMERHFIHSVILQMNGQRKSFVIDKMYFGEKGVLHVDEFKKIVNRPMSGENRKKDNDRN